MKFRHRRKNRSVRPNEIEQLESRTFLAADLGNVLPLGDSITHGSQFIRSYRYELWKDLIDDNVTYQFVGSQTSNFIGNPFFADYQGQQFDNRHEGHWSQTSDFILANLPTWLSDYDADTVFLHLGTNDIRLHEIADPPSMIPDAQVVTDTVDAMEDIVELLQADNPNVSIYVAQVIPYYRLTHTQEVLDEINEMIVEYNSQLATMAPTWSTASSQVVIVDQWSDPENEGQPLPASYYFDEVHPSPEGEELMSERWLAAVNENMDDTTSPRVTDVKLNSTSWQPVFRQFVDSEDQGYSIPKGSQQLDIIPFFTVDQILIQFSEPVVISAANIDIEGVVNPSLQSEIASVTFDESTLTATIDLAIELPADRYQLFISDTVVDAASNILDGEWESGVSTGMSGDGNAGGVFDFTFNILPGDLVGGASTPGNGLVDTSDILAVRNARFENVTSEGYNPLFDTDGSGIIDTTDILNVRDRRFSSLPPAIQAATKLEEDNENKRLLSKLIEGKKERRFELRQRAFSLFKLFR